MQALRWELENGYFEFLQRRWIFFHCCFNIHSTHLNHALFDSCIIFCSCWTGDWTESVLFRPVQVKPSYSMPIFRINNAINLNKHLQTTNFKTANHWLNCMLLQWCWGFSLVHSQKDLIWSHLSMINYAICSSSEVLNKIQVIHFVGCFQCVICSTVLVVMEVVTNFFLFFFYNMTTPTKLICEY